MVFVSIIVFILIFSFLILIHEFGHFFVAKKCGIKVEEFGIGFGKKIFAKKYGETEYSLNLIPMGGFVKLLGENEKIDDPRSFDRAAVWKKMMISLAGIFLNFIFAIFALTFLFSVGTNPILITKNDLQTSFINREIFFQNNSGQKISVDEFLTQKNSAQIFFIKKTKLPFPQSFFLAVKKTEEISMEVFKKISEIPQFLFKNKKLPPEISGPVGIAKILHEILPNGFLAILKFAALISISLGAVNFLPFPALDGGRFLFQIFELFLLPFGKKPNPKIENSIHIFGMIFLIFLFLIVTGQDILKLF